MAGGSKSAVYIALSANVLVTIAKFGGFMVTGSGAMLSETVHSLADVGNQALLAFGMAQSAKPADASHPEGYGRDAFVWATISAVGMFFLGCGVSVTHALESLLSSHPHQAVSASEGRLNLIILVVALVIEGSALTLAIRGLRGEAQAHDQTLWQYLTTTDDPFGIAVLLEDGGAVIGVIFALIAVGLTQYTGHAYWDALGSLAIGILLGVIATYLVYKNRGLLIGRSIRPEDQARLNALFVNDPAIEKVAMQKTLVTGTSSYRISAELDFDGAYFADQYLNNNEASAIVTELNTPEELRVFLTDYSEHLCTQIGLEIDRIEGEIRDAVPKATSIALEPD